MFGLEGLVDVGRNVIICSFIAIFALVIIEAILLVLESRNQRNRGEKHDN